MKRRIAAASILVITLTSLAISAQQRTASAPAAPGARSQPTYFPERFEWQHRRPEEVGMNAALVTEAIKAATSQEIAGNKDLTLEQKSSLENKQQSEVISRGGKQHTGQGK